MAPLDDRRSPDAAPLFPLASPRFASPRSPLPVSPFPGRLSPFRLSSVTSPGSSPAFDWFISTVLPFLFLFFWKFQWHLPFHQLSQVNWFELGTRLFELFPFLFSFSLSSCCFDNLERETIVYRWLSSALKISFDWNYQSSWWKRVCWMLRIVRASSHESPDKSKSHSMNPINAMTLRLSCSPPLERIN